MDTDRPDPSRGRLANDSISLMTRVFNSHRNSEAARMAYGVIEKFSPSILTEDKSELHFTSKIPLLLHEDCRKLSTALNIYALASVALAGSSATLEERLFTTKLLYAASRLNPGNINKRFDLVSMVYATTQSIGTTGDHRTDHSKLREALLNLGQAAVYHVLGGTKEQRASVMLGCSISEETALHRRTPNVLAFGVCFCAGLADLERDRGNMLSAKEMACKGLRYAELVREVVGLSKDLSKFLVGLPDKLSALSSERRFALFASMKSEPSLLRVLANECQALELEALMGAYR